MTACPECRSVFDLSSNDEISGLREVTSAQREVSNPDPAPDLRDEISVEDGQQRDHSLVREVSDKMVCSACKCPFTNREEQIEHYKLDWHRFNLRLKMTGLLPLTAEEFESKTGAGDLSSISGSESDSEEEDSDSENGGTSSNVTGTDNESSGGNHRLSSKLVFQSATGEYLSVYRCILQGKSIEELDAASALKVLNRKTVWVILMTGGGHFAGAVFEGKQVLQHKTFHRYTVRAKRGTAQGLRDSQNRSHAPKSAGAALRRHNEAALVKDIQDLLVTWAEHLKAASAIFIRAPSYNKTIFFGGRAAPLDKKDPRVRTLPFATRRATFREVQRVHELLSTAHVHGKDTDLSAIFSPSKKAWKKTVKARAQVNTDQEKGSFNPAEVKVESSDEEDGGDIRLEMVELTLGTLDLREFEVHPSRSRRRRRRRKEDSKVPNEDRSDDAELQEDQLPDATPAEDIDQETQSKSRRRRKPANKKQLDGAAEETCNYGLKDALFTACKAGDVDTLYSLLQPPANMESEEQPENNPCDTSSALTLLNKPIDSSGFTLLHAATAAAQKAVVKLLLDAGADPACRDNKGRTPYIVAPDKDTRNVYRKYMGENPDKYDYTKAQVPGPLTAEIESKKMEKKKAQKAQKKQRDKEQKEEKRKQELEAEEKQRFASLTDREKRALAAERRLAEQVAAKGASISNVKRCWLCGESLLGKIPFHYLEYSFCSPRCVQEHRKSHAPQGKA